MEKLSFIGADQTILLWAVVLAIVAGSIYLEQRYRWASTISSTILVIIGGFIVANLGLVPHSTAVFSSIGNVVLLCAIPLFLFKANVREILKNTKHMLIIFHVVAVGCVLGALVGYFVMSNGVEYAAEMVTMATAGEVGGTVNSLAMKEIYGIPESLFTASAVTGNICVAILFMIMKFTGNSKLVRGKLPTPHIDAVESGVDVEALRKEGKTLSAVFWGGKEIGLKDIAMALAVTFVIVGVSQSIAGWVVSLNPPSLIKELFGSVYMILTLITVILATIAPKFMGDIKGTMELGNIGMLCWFCTIGMSGNLITIIKEGLVFGVLWLFVAVIELIFAYVACRILKANWEDAVICTAVAAGGPPTGAAFAVALGWDKMIIPGMLMGLWGYCIGNYGGILVANIIGLAPVI